MSIFGNIVSAIFGSKHAATATAAPAPRSLLHPQARIRRAPLHPRPLRLAPQHRPLVAQNRFQRLTSKRFLRSSPKNKTRIMIGKGRSLI
jgi:hypothetical protein